MSVANPLPPSVEAALDEMYLALADLSSSSSDFEELRSKWEGSEAWDEIVEQHCTRYDDIACLCREKLNQAREELKAVWKQVT